MKVYLIFGESLSELMIKRGVSRKKLAEAVGLSESTIGRYCMGKSRFVATHAIAIAEYFQVSLDSFLGK